jgi:hypothetical protein
MRMTWSLSVIAAVVLAMAGTASAQTVMPSAAAYENCREQAIAGNLAGEARNTAIGQCMTNATANPNAGRQLAQYEACREDAITRNLAGEARAKAINECVSVATVEPAAGNPAYSYDSCRSGAVVRGLRGDALSQFIERCTKGQ